MTIFFCSGTKPKVTVSPIAMQVMTLRFPRGLSFSYLSIYPPGQNMALKQGARNLIINLILCGLRRTFGNAKFTTQAS